MTRTVAAPGSCAGSGRRRRRAGRLPLPLAVEAELLLVGVVDAGEEGPVGQDRDHGQAQVAGDAPQQVGAGAGGGVPQAPGVEAAVGEQQHALVQAPGQGECERALPGGERAGGGAEQAAGAAAGERDEPGPGVVAALPAAAAAGPGGVPRAGRDLEGGAVPRCQEQPERVRPRLLPRQRQRGGDPGEQQLEGAGAEAAAQRRQRGGSRLLPGRQAEQPAQDPPVRQAAGQAQAEHEVQAQPGRQQPQPRQRKLRR